MLHRPGVLLGGQGCEGGREGIDSAKTKLPPDVSLIALAACYEALNQPDKAEAKYTEALKAKPGDLGVLDTVASFYLKRGQRALAEPLLRKIIALGPRDSTQVTQARRTLALAIGSVGDYQRYREALALLDENAKAGKAEEADDQRIRALLLARQPGRRKQAIEKLEAAFALRPATPSESFYLAVLYADSRDWKQAQRLLQNLLASRDGSNPAYLIYYLEQLIQNKDLAQTGDYLDRLKRIEADSFRTIGIEARLLQARGRRSDAKTLLKRHAAEHAKDPAWQLGVGRLLEILGYPEDAETYYQSVASTYQDKNPRACLALIQYLGRRNRLPEAMKLCETVQGKIPNAELAMTYVTIMRDGKPTDGECKQAADWLARVKKMESNPALFDLCLANLSDLKGKTPEAIESYRELIARDGNNCLARNNLAVLLAYQPGKGGEALECIGKAIEVAGRHPEFLDTRGIVHLALRQPAKAVECLEEATQMNPDPASHFRLACAYLADNKPGPARGAWARAQSGGFVINNLHPLERPAAQPILAQLMAEEKSAP